MPLDNRPDHESTERSVRPSLIPRLTIKRLFRSLDLLRRFGTPKKIQNVIRAEIAFRRREGILTSRPYIFRADSTTLCALNCPYCLRTQNEPRPPKSLLFDEFRQKFEPFREWCLLVPFQMFGDPTMNPELPKMIDHVRAAGAATYVSTNLQSVDEDYLKRLLSSGLSLLTISLDAATPPTYQRMKPGGGYEALMENIHRLFELKRSIRQPPAVGFQVLVTRHNESELPAIREFARKIGADYLDFKSVYFLPDPSWAPLNPRYRPPAFQHRKVMCAIPWTGITLLADGSFFPCCAFPGDFNLGAPEGDLMETVWNGEKMRALRAGFKTGRLEPLCRDCTLGRIPRF